MLKIIEKLWSCIESGRITLKWFQPLRLNGFDTKTDWERQYRITNCGSKHSTLAISLKTITVIECSDLHNLHPFQLDCFFSSDHHHTETNHHTTTFCRCCAKSVAASSSASKTVSGAVEASAQGNPSVTPDGFFSLQQKSEKNVGWKTRPASVATNRHVHPLMKAAGLHEYLQKLKMFKAGWPI